MLKQKEIKKYPIKDYFLKFGCVLLIGFFGISPLIMTFMIMANDITENIKQIVFPILLTLFGISNVISFYWLKKTQFNYYYYYPIFSLIMIAFTIGALLTSNSEVAGYIFFGLWCLIFASYFMPIWMHFRKFKLTERL